MTDQGHPHPDKTPERRDSRRLAAYIERYSPGRGLDAERLLEIRLRIASGFYDRPGVRLTAAARLLESGDVKTRDSLPD